MKALNDLNIFVETARQGSFSKAANSMDMTPAAISASIKRLEGQIGFPLFVRSTRSLRLTSEGELFLDKTTQALATLQEGLDQISSARGSCLVSCTLLHPPILVAICCSIGWMSSSISTQMFPLN